MAVSTSALMATEAWADIVWLLPLINMMLPLCPAAGLVKVSVKFPAVVHLKSLPTAKSKLPSLSVVT